MRFIFAVLALLLVTGCDSITGVDPKDLPPGTVAINAFQYDPPKAQPGVVSITLCLPLDTSEACKAAH